MPAIASSATARFRPLIQHHDAGWSNPKVLTIFALIFICGLASGVVGTNSFYHWKMHATLGPGQMTLSQLRTALQLNPQQETTIAKELDDYAKYYQNIEEEREDVANNGKQNILKVLSPEQQKRFLAIFNFPGPSGPRMDHAR